MSKVPPELKYTKEHEWVRMEGEVAVVGITDHAQAALGDIVYVELPKAGATVTAMKPFGSVDSVKASSELFSPLSGKIAEVNSELEDALEKINQDPYGDGWMIKIQPSNQAEFASLLDAAAYQKFLDESQ